MFDGADAVPSSGCAARCYAAVYGADLYAYGLLANGRVDLVCEALAASPTTTAPRCR